MGSKPPEFAPSDNPAADSDHLLTRLMTFNFLPSFNVWLLLSPVTLSFDWSMQAIPLLQSLSDARNIASLLFYCSLLLLADFCLVSVGGIQNYKGVLCGKLQSLVSVEEKSSVSSRQTGGHSDVGDGTVHVNIVDCVIVSVSLMVFPFIPATNLLFYVGFVVAERVLYIPSAGFCLLVAVGAERLCTLATRRTTRKVELCVLS